MAESLLTMDGMENLLDDLEELGQYAPSVAAHATDEVGVMIESRIKANYIVMFSGHTETGAMYDSISHTSGYSETGAYGSFGVFKIDHVMTAHGYKAGTVGRPQVALWYELGIQAHQTRKGSRAARAETASSRARAAKGQDGGGTGAIAPKPFISAAIDSSMNEAWDLYIKEFNNFHSLKGF